MRDTVYRIESNAAGGVTIGSAAGKEVYDACIITAGAATSQLASQVDLYTPSALLHHLCATFRLRDPRQQPPCLIERHSPWRPGVSTYQHLAAPGLWAVGAHVDPADCAWERGRDLVTSFERRLLMEYVRENLDNVDADIVSELSCNMASGWGDGFGVARTSNVVALYGDNLFKFAPVLGEILGGAVISGATFCP